MSDRFQRLVDLAECNDEGTELIQLLRAEVESLRKALKHLYDEVNIMPVPTGTNMAAAMGLLTALNEAEAALKIEG